MRALVPILILSVASAALAATPWEEYLDEPTPENASRVSKVEYTRNLTRTAQLSADDLQVLQNQVFGRESQSFRLAVRLYRASDGADAEGLGVLLGRTARVQPDFFLREMAGIGIPCSVLAWPLRSAGLEYVDRPAAQRYEITRRQEALRSVRARSLGRVRAQCLAVFTVPN